MIFFALEAVPAGEVMRDVSIEVFPWVNAWPLCEKGLLDTNGRLELLIPILSCKFQQCIYIYNYIYLYFNFIINLNKVIVIYN